MEALQGLGDETAVRWLTSKLDDDEPDARAMADLDDIAKSHGLVYLSSTKTDPESETALGVALALNKRIVLIGTPTNQYHHLPMIERYASLKEFIETREDEKNVGV